jgi:hypothetical protein
MKRTLALMLLALLAAAPAEAAKVRSVDLPKLFATQITKAKAKSDVPILLPQVFRSDFKKHFPEGSSRARGWTFDIGAAKDCHTATACFVAEFRAQRGGRPSGDRTVQLARGRTGFFTPLSCGASCSPPSIQWRERGAVYVIQAKVVGKERRALVKLANSAIRRGPR